MQGVYAAPVEEEDICGSSVDTATLSCSTTDNETIPSEERRTMWEKWEAERICAQEWMDNEERVQKLKLAKDNELRSCVASRTCGKTFSATLRALPISTNVVHDWMQRHSTADSSDTCMLTDTLKSRTAQKRKYQSRP